MDAGEAVVDVVLGQHDLANAPEKLRLVFPHPQQLGSCEPGESDVGGVPAQLLPSYDPVEVLHLLPGPPVVPEDSGADHRVVFIQRHQPVHLTARADAPDLAGVQTLQQLRDTGADRFPPVRRVLLAPARTGEFNRIFPAGDADNFAAISHQQELHRRGAQIDPNRIHSVFTSLHCFFPYQPRSDGPRRELEPGGLIRQP